MNMKMRAYYKPLNHMLEPEQIESINFETKVLGVYMEMDGKGYHKLCMSDFEIIQCINYYGLELHDGCIMSIACDCDSEYGCTHPDSKYLVVWGEENAGYALKSLSNGRIYPLDEYGVENMQVIGNRFDNPELLLG